MGSIAPTGKKLYLTRHAEAQHNATSDWTIRDAELTELGRKQCLDLNEATSNNIQETAELLVCSVMRRPMETMILGYPKLRKRLEKEGKPPIILDILQEANGHGCDTPTYPLEDLVNSQGGIFADLDFSGISPEYASKEGIFAPSNVPERARRVRHFLRDRPEGEIVVVAHGDILRALVGNQFMDLPWENTQVRVYTFASSTDEQAALVPTSGKEVRPKSSTDEPTSSEM